MYYNFSIFEILKNRLEEEIEDNFPSMSTT